MKTFHIITLFPGSFDSYLSESIIGRAQKEKLIAVKFYNPRDFVVPTKVQAKNDKPYLRIDDRPYGGGPGMVMQALPVIKAIAKAKGTKKKVKIIFLSPGGKQFDTPLAKEYVQDFTDIIIVCGRYEGIDARIKEVFLMDDISIGPFVITGGELGAMIMIDCMARQVEGVLGDFNSREEERIASHDVYTRPEVINYKKKKYPIPEVLKSGNHKAIDDWRAGK
jgi:tRNA (guanine37-N1)-methyltransferase